MSELKKDPREPNKVTYMYSFMFILHTLIILYMQRNRKKRKETKENERAPIEVWKARG